MTDEQVDLEALLRHLKEARGFDFTGYKRPSLTRRIDKRLAEVGAEDYGRYLALLQERPHEYTSLFNTILINVTSFFRDAPAWQHLAADVLPLLADRPDDEPIRVWSAGCASGEETYSAAMLLCEALGEDRFRRSVKIYGSDADEEAIAQARQARYPAKAVHASVPDDLAERYFTPAESGWTFRSDLRRSIVFGRNDLVQDPPISRVDLVLCRNTLMYLNADIQRRILGNFHFALNDGGYLFLGKSEALVTRTNLFHVEDVRHHIFRRRSGVRAARPPIVPPINLPPAAASPDESDVLLRASFEAAGGAQLLVDRRGNLALANRQARTLFGISPTQVGRPFKDLEVSYRPVELRSRIEQVLEDHRAQVTGDVEWQAPDGSTMVFEARLQPVGSESAPVGVGITFVETGRYRSLREELDRSQRQLATAYEELQSTVEELETTNEELQSTNEELETTNEELHSTNEELETMNEELQSTNEELETINDELRQRSLQLDEVNGFLGTILSSLGSAVVVLDDSLHVRIWNREAEELWGLRADEVHGTHFLNLDIGLPVGDLRADIWAVSVEEPQPRVVEVEAVNRRGRPIGCQVVITPLLTAEGTLDGVILRMETRDRPSAAPDRGTRA